MDYTKKRAKQLISIILLLIVNIFSSCQEEIKLIDNENGKMLTAIDLFGSLKDENFPKRMRTIELRKKDITTQLCLHLSQNAPKAIDLKLEIDETLLEKYNIEHGTSFEIFPKELVTIEEDGNILMAPGQRKSDPVDLLFKSSSKLKEGKSYILPISVQSISENIKFLKKENHYLYVIKIMNDIPSAEKASGIKTVIFFEVNDCNILNAGEYTLKKTGKPFADVVCIFAANISYDVKSGKVFLKCNESVKQVLNNRDKYIKPLQDKGIKVTLAVLGNHDIAGLGKLSDEATKLFAKELKSYVDAYKLDGIEFDDEYSNSGTVPGIFESSPERMARLVFETKMIMPDKLCSVYHIGAAEGGFHDSIDDVDPGDFIDYTYEAYYRDFNASIWFRYKGMTQKQNAPYSRNISTGVHYDRSLFENVRAEYGVNMLYNFNPKNDYYYSFNTIANILYDEGIHFSGKVFPKDY